MANKIMGGEFSINEDYLSNEYENNNIVYSSGRCALYCILKNIERALNKTDTGKILLPNYLCESITNTVKDAGWRYCFYNIDKKLHIDFSSIEQLIDNFDVIILINYFGMVKLEEDVNYLRELSPNTIVIEDDVQAFYELESSIADYSFTSLRKWFPCPDGAMVRTDKQFGKELQLNKNNWVQYKLAGNLIKNYTQFIDDKVALELLNKGEKLLDSEYLTECSEASKKIFHSLDLSEIAKQRKQNASYLHQELTELQVSHLYIEDSVPLFMPIFIESRDELRKLFFANKIFTPVHWPEVNEKLNGTNSIYRQELSLLVDQRYSIEDMEKQINVLKQFYKKV